MMVGQHASQKTRRASLPGWKPVSRTGSTAGEYDEPTIVVGPTLSSWGKAERDQARREQLFVPASRLWRQGLRRRGQLLTEGAESESVGNGQAGERTGFSRAIGCSRLT